MTMRDSELRRLLRMPLQAFGQEETTAMPGAAGLATDVALRVRRLTPSRLRVFFSPAHDVSPALYAALEVVEQKDSRSWPGTPDWHGRDFRRLLRTWTPQSHVDVSVHPANQALLPTDAEIVVGGWAPADGHDGAMSLAMLAAPLSRDSVPQVMAALVTHLASAELRGAARRRHPNRLSRHPRYATADPAGPQPAAPPGRLPFRRPNLRPALNRLLPTRRNLRLCP
jgi:hypothetical protein